MRGTNQTRRSTVAAAGVAVLLLSSACTGEPDDTPTAPTFAPAPAPSTAEPEPSTPPSSEPSAEPTTEALDPPELPAAATEETPEGAAAFAEWWFETLNYAFATGDTTALRESSELASCMTCENFIERIEVAYTSGGDIQGGQLAVEVDPPLSVNEGVASFVVRVSASPAIETIDGNSTDLPGGDSVAAVAVFWRQGWIMGDIAA